MQARASLALPAHPYQRRDVQPQQQMDAISLPDWRSTTVALKVIVFSVVILQRFAVPGLTTALCAPIVLAATAYLVINRALVEDRTNIGGYLVAMTICCIAATLSSALFGLTGSLSSLALLIVLYIPFCFRLRPQFGQLLPELLGFFTKIMVVLAGVALVQWAVQIAGFRYRDPLAVLPHTLLLQTYNTFYPIHYGASIVKTNAVVFLEPSFCSQYLALAIVVQLLLGRHRWRIALFGAALVTTLSGTGLLLLGVGLAVLGVRRGGRWVTRAVLVVGALGVLFALSPVGAQFTSRASEFSQPNSSGNARFVAPYVQVVDGFFRDVPALLVGRGPGAVARPSGLLFFDPLGTEANYPVVPKVAAEYGLIAAIAFTWFIVRAIAGRTRSPTIAACLLMLYLVLSGSLLQPASTYTCLVFGSFFALSRRRTPDPMKVSAGVPH